MEELEFDTDYQWYSVGMFSILNNTGVTFNNISMTVPFQYDEGTVEMTVTISSDLIKKYFTRFFIDKKFLFMDNQERALTYIVSLFNSVWSDYVNAQKENLINSIRAYNWIYNPLDNNDRYEHITITYSGTETETDTRKTTYNGTETNTDTTANTKSGKIITTPSGTQTQTRSGNITDEIDKKGYDSSSLVNANKSTQTFNSVKDETSYSNFKTEQEYSTLKDTHSGAITKTFSNRSDDKSGALTKTFSNRKDNTDNHTHGNIGTTKSQEMVLDELSLRCRDLTFEFIKRFSNMYLIW